MRPFSLHGLVLLASIAAVLAVAYAHGLRVGPEEPVPPAMLAFEHEDPVAVALSVARSEHGRLMELTNSGGKAIFASVPDDWERTEVRGAALADAEKGASALGFTRWTLPASATIVFRGSVDFESIVIANPPGLPLAVRLVTVDLDTQRTEVQSVIVTDDAVTLPLLPSEPIP